MNRDDRNVLAIGGFGLSLIALVFAGWSISSKDNTKTITTSTGSSSGAAEVVELHMNEFKFTPAMPEVAPGDVTLKVVNDGTLTHSLAFVDLPFKTKQLQPGESQTLNLKDVKAGDYDFYCEIVGHADSGMKGMLMVAEGATGTDGSSATPDTVTASWQDMDKAMNERALRFVNEAKGTFGGQPLEPKVLADGTKEFDLTAKVVDWEVEPGKVVKAWTYNGIVPGPEIKVDVGDKVKVVLKNELPESTVIHFHGIRVPNAMDGVDPYTQLPVEPGQSFTYEFTALEPSVGMYHSHHDAQTQVPNGLAGAFIIGEMPIPESLAAEGITKVDKTVNMVLDDAGNIGLALNGKSFPATEPYSMKVGQVMEVNYFNEGLMIHPMHMHQPVGWIIAKDGHPLATPEPADTIAVAPGERYTVLYKFVDPGVWAWHCHILNHAEGPNGMFGMVTAVIVEE